MMFQQIISKFHLDQNEFQFQFNSHPSYPSALAFADTLNFMGVRNESYLLEKEYWDELPEKFITIYKNDFALVQRNNSHVKIFSEKDEQISFDELKTDSTDFVLLFDENSDEKGSVKSHLFQNVFLGFALTILLSINIFNWNIWSFIFQILSLTGVYLFWEIFKGKFGKESPVLQNFCGLGAKQNAAADACKTIIQSKDFQLFGLSFSDFGLIYFIGLSVLPSFIVKSSILFLLISGLATLSIFYSVYYQFSKKSFCKVCALAIGILMVQFAVAFLYFKTDFHWTEILISAFVFMISFLGVEIFSKALEEKERYRKENIKNLKFKRNYNIFKEQLIKDENRVDFKVKEGGFILGNRSADLKISVVSNPFCGYCKDAHLLLEKLVDQNSGKLQVHVRFNYGGKNDNELTDLLSIFKNIYQNQGEKKFNEVLNYWYSTRDLKDLKQKYPFLDEVDLSDVIALSKDNTENRLNFTPSFIISDWQFPKYYEREDVLYFIEELLEDEDLVLENKHQIIL